MRRRLTTNKLGLALVGLALMTLTLGCPTSNEEMAIATGVYISLNGMPAPTPVNLRVGVTGANYAALVADVRPSNANNGVSWHSSNTDVATVTNGRVYAIGQGRATITVETADGNHSDSVNIRVIGSPTVAGSKSVHAGDLLILQVGAAAAGAVGRTFVELFNTTNTAIDLDGFSLQWAVGTGEYWDIIKLEGTIPGNSSFLVVGDLATQPETRRLHIPDADADMVVNDFSLSNRAFRVALMQNQNTLTVRNPSDMGSAAVDMREGMPPADNAPCTRTIGATVAAGLVDLLGVVNEWGDARDVIHGAEASPAFRISQQVAIRRASLEDTDNNFNDFILIDYREWSAGNPYRLTDEQVYIFRPRGSAFQPRNIQFPEPGQEFEPGPGTERLLILQANRSGNDNGGGGGFPRALVELFNNTDSPIDLAAGNFYLHTGNATAWTHVVPLTGTVPARSSFLIASNIDTNPVHRADLPAADQYADFYMGGANHWRVAIMTNQSALLAVDNPFGDESLVAYYVDMLGVGNSTAFETSSGSASQPQGPRRTSLDDTDNNAVDFSQVDFRGHWEGTARTPNANLHRIWPRNAGAGEWNPMTGIPAVHPTVRNPATNEVEFPVTP